jgi:hypothetical protein
MWSGVRALDEEGADDDDDVDLSKPHPNVFLQRTLEVIAAPDDFAFFNGHYVKRHLGNGLLLAPNTPGIRTWGDVVKMANERGNSKMKNASSNAAVHMHNEFMAGDFIELFQKELRKTKRYSGGLFTRDDVNTAFSQKSLTKPLVITNSVDENWGFLSHPINTRTAKWINMTNHLRIHHADYDTLRSILDHDSITMLTANAHVAPGIGAHKKVISLPLGVRYRDKVFAAMKAYRNTNKTKLFNINNSGWKERSLINKVLIDTFRQHNYTIMNTFKGKTPAHIMATRHKSEVFDDFYQEVVASKFSLCPSGLSMDSYRLWETIALGSIPVVESNAGFDRTYANLPVLVVHNFSAVTPQLLMGVYPCFYANAARYKAVHLTSLYWHKLIHRTVKQGSMAHVTRMHPFRNAYCDVLSADGTATVGITRSKRPDHRSAQPVVARRQRR